MIPVTIDQLRIGEVVTVVRDGKTWEATVVHRSPGKTVVHLQASGQTSGAMAYTKSEVKRFVFRKPIDRGLTTKELMEAQGFPVGHGETFDVGADGRPRKRVATALADTAPVHPSRWGRDHLSTLLYLETRIVDHKGTIKIENMRCHVGRHPERRHPASSIVGHSPTRLANGAEIADHDDWDCLEDFIAAGLAVWGGTGLNPEIRFTDRGWQAAHACRRHRAEGMALEEQCAILRHNASAR